MLRFIRNTTSRRPVAVARVSVGLLALVAGPVVRHHLDALFEPSVVRARDFEWVPDLRPGHVVPLMVLWSLAALGFASGAGVRPCGLAMVAFVAYVFAVDQSTYAGYLYVVGLLTLLLTLAGGGTPRPGDPEGRAPAWPIVLARIQLSLIYLFTATAKVNFNFLSGSILHNSLAVPFPSRWPAPSFQAMAVVVIATEYFLGLGLWVKRVRPAVFLAGFVFHCAIVLLVKGTPMDRLELFVFGFTTLTAYLFFLEAAPASRAVVWEGGDRPPGWMAAARRLDWLGILDFPPPASAGRGPAGGELTVEAAGVRHRGFAAIGQILEVLPVSFLWAPAFRLYAIVAR